MSNEEWRSAVGFEGRYEVSTLGRIRSLDRKFIRKDGRPDNRLGRVMRQRVNKHGYHQCHLANEQHRKTILVHRIVLATFVENVRNLETVNHKDGNKLNNRIDNLEWASKSENSTHAIRTGLFVPVVMSPCMTDEQVEDALDMLRDGYSLRSTGIKFGVCGSTVRNNIKRRYSDFHWSQYRPQRGVCK